MSILNNLKSMYTISKSQKNFVKHHKNSYFDLAIYDLCCMVDINDIPKQYSEIPERALCSLLTIYFNGSCFEDGDYFEYKSPTRGVGFLEKIAKSENLWNSWAASSLGRYYSTGMHCEPQLDEAVKWFKIAAERGFDDAKLMLAYLYTFHLSSEHNLREAESLLDRCLDFSEHRDMDFISYKVKKALFSCDPDHYSYESPLELLEKSVGKQNPYAMVELAEICKSSNRYEAERLLNEAAELGHEPAVFLRAVDENYNGNIENVDARFITKYAYLNVSLAQRELSNRFFLGEKGVEQDIVQAAVWHTLAFRNPRTLSFVSESFPALNREEVSVVVAKCTRIAKERNLNLYDTLDTKYAWGKSFQRPIGVFLEI